MSRCVWALSTTAAASILSCAATGTYRAPGVTHSGMHTHAHPHCTTTQKNHLVHTQRISPTHHTTPHDTTPHHTTPHHTTPHHTTPRPHVPTHLHSACACSIFGGQNHRRSAASMTPASTWAANSPSASSRARVCCTAADRCATAAPTLHENRRRLSRPSTSDGLSRERLRAHESPTQMTTHTKKQTNKQNK